MSSAAFRDLLRGDEFLFAAELVTSRGTLFDKRAARALEMGRTLAADERFSLLSITDNPAGSAMLAPETLGREIKNLGQEVNIHLACKDANRNGLQARAFALASEGFNNVLAMSGDEPITGYRGRAGSVFDIDSVGLIKLLSDMNAGLDPIYEGEAPHERTNFTIGCAMTNHKRQEREVMPLYFKLRKKVQQGAHFVINQIAFNARKDDELLRWMEREDCAIPVFANVYVLSRGAARAFHREHVPGVPVSDELLAEVEKQARSKDNGREFFIDLAARQVAISRGLGYKGAYLGGHVAAEDFQEIVDRADRFAADDHKEFAKQIQYGLRDEFYFFERDPDTGLSSDQVNASYLESKRGSRLGKKAKQPRYAFSRAAHNVVFAEDAPLHKPARAFFAATDNAPKPIGRALHLFEQASKIPLFGCEDCGDCSLPDIAYLCPESSCAKNQRNGPCGGTRDGGRCEVEEFDCIWSRAYDRLKAYGEEETMLDGPVVIKDAALHGSSAWRNTFLGRDHHARGDERP
ncbi:MAG TPA: methylenetetrahydrofolate reductase C-terminal domain-containing protein [Baekduia sp.]|nr:methylenetetrahydrofolate reductase C-terminal domain-containing protein [Baekduia sp.]